MLRRASMVAAVVAAALTALPSGASFLASDLVYVPVAAHNPGENDSLWQTDLYITNVDTTPVDVVVFFLPTGLVNNGSYLTSRTYALGGREAEGYGFVNAELAAIPPHATVVLGDLVGEYWEPTLGQTLVGQGGLVVLACEEGRFLPTGGCGQYRNVVVQSRTYNRTTIWVPDTENEGEFLEQEATYGQVMPGVPWYNLADGGATLPEANLTYQVLPGATQTDEFRFNLGVLNASDPQTSIFIRITPYGADGEQLVDDEDRPLSFSATLPPLAHIQFNRVLTSAFRLEGDVSNVTLRVGFDTIGWSTSNPTPFPAFTAYGSVVDNRSNDPTTILPSFAFPYDVDCMWSPSEAGVMSVRELREQGRRPVEIPPQE